MEITIVGGRLHNKSELSRNTKSPPSPLGGGGGWGARLMSGDLSWIFAWRLVVWSGGGGCCCVPPPSCCVCSGRLLARETLDTLGCLNSDFEFKILEGSRWFILTPPG